MLWAAVSPVCRDLENLGSTTIQLTAVLSSERVFYLWGWNEEMGRREREQWKEVENQGGNCTVVGGRGVNSLVSQSMDQWVLEWLSIIRANAEASDYCRRLDYTSFIEDNCLNSAHHAESISFKSRARNVSLSPRFCGNLLQHMLSIICKVVNLQCSGMRMKPQL